MVKNKNILKSIGESFFLLQSKKSIKDAIPPILELLGKSNQVDRVYIFRNYRAENGELYFYKKYEWAANGVISQTDFEKLQNVSWSVYPIIFEKLKRNLVLNEVLDKESNGDDFFNTMAEQGILSFLFIPIMVDHQFWGFIGFDNCSSKEIYSDEQVAALHAFASTLGYTILAKRQKKKVIESKAKLFFSYKHG